MQQLKKLLKKLFRYKENIKIDDEWVRKTSPFLILYES